MSNNYARRTGRYKLPPNVRGQLVYLIKDYPRMKEEAEAILDEYSSAIDGMPTSSKPSDIVHQKAARRETLLTKIAAIDAAFSAVPEEYRMPIYENLVYKKPYPDYAHRTTFWRHRARVLYKLAQNLYMI